MSVQHGGNSPFETRRAGDDGDRGDGRLTGAAELHGKIEQVLGVVAAAHAKMDNGVVAGALAFETQARRGDPDERVEPAGAAQELTTDLHNPVAPPHTREP